MFDDVIQLAATKYSPQDKCRLNIGHGDLSSDIVVHLQNLENLDGQAVMNRFERVLNSHENMSADDTFEISVGLLRTNKGGGKPNNKGKGRKPRNGKKALHLLPHLNMNNIHNAVLNKTAIVNILPDEGPEQLCAAKSIVVADARLKTDAKKMKKDAYYNLIRKNRQFSMSESCLKFLALRLQGKTGLPTNRPLTVPELSLFENHVQAKILVIQFVDDQVNPVVTQCSADAYEREIYLYLVDNHFYPVVNVNAMFPDKKLCRKCYQVYRLKSPHPCVPEKCFVCTRTECQLGQTVKCVDCNMTCRNEACFQAHRAVTFKKKQSRCDVNKKCHSCGKVVNTRKIPLSDHVCDTYECRTCGKWVESSHLCYLRRKKMKTTSGKFIFFDFESIQSERYECREGYQPRDTPGNGCGKTIGPDGVQCSDTVTCLKCKLCTNCKKSNCGRFVHQPNFVVAESSCDTCKDEVLTDKSVCKNCGDLCADCATNRLGKCRLPAECGIRRRIFRGLDTTYEFCCWLLSPPHRNYVCIAHNGKAYDFSFILNYLVSEARMTPECVFAGAKLMGMEVRNGLDIKFVDSINFMGMALSKLPGAFGLEPEQLGLSGADVTELAKLPFPHRFNTRENMDYVGPFPPIEMYDVDSMREEDAKKLREWYSSQQGKNFDMQEQLQIYCTLDTSILRLACNRFRDLVKSVTLREWEDGEVTYVDCFSHLTIASMVMQVYRLNHIEEFFEVTLSDGRQVVATKRGGDWNVDGDPLPSGEIVDKSFVSSSIAQLPAQGYVRSSNHSKKSIGWLEYQSSLLGRQIIHARNYGEQKIKCGDAHYLADGFDPLERACYLFHGCFYHGHSCQTRKVKDKRTGFYMRDLNDRTKKVEAAIKKAGYRLFTIYECEWDKIVSQSPEIQNFLKKLDVPQRLRIRDAFFGGRTSGFKLHHACEAQEEIHYVDVCSLYPYINKTAKMPTGHPTIITKDFDLTLKSYFGIAHVKILPPKHEYIPVLPVRLHGKLTFPLCRICAEREQQDQCGHSTDERAISGVWCTPELMAAIDQGYSVLKVYEVYHYEKSSQYDPETGQGGLFAQQVDLFLKIKAEASGYPENVVTEADKDEFVTEFQKKCGVLLDKEKISPNPALRSISKICLNSFWGKLGQKPNKPKCRYIREISELTKMLNNAMCRVLNFHIINEDVMVIVYNDADGFEEESFVTNEVLAAFTTCWARLELYRHMKMVGRNILYCDTDSLIFRTKKTVAADGTISFENHPPLGNSLGELTNELKPNTFIKEFVCSAPKSYSFITNTGKESTKFKGVTLNGLNSVKVNFKAVKELILGNIDEITLHPQTQFKRDKFQGVVTNAPLVKKLVPTYNKRRILQNFDTVPFGYIEPVL